MLGRGISDWAQTGDTATGDDLAVDEGRQFAEHVAQQGKALVEPRPAAGCTVATANSRRRNDH
jgi:hypothetical protein